MMRPLDESRGRIVPAIGPYPLRNAVLLAPMAGITDAPFRQVAWRAGAGYVASEMVTSQSQLWDTEKSRLRRQWPEAIEPRVVQLAGSDPADVADAARRHVAHGAQIIDLNFGCPAKKVCRRASGSQLLREPALVAAIAGAAARAVTAPVTVKMRTGWSPEARNAVEVARRLEEAGIAAITVHGRTRCCFFTGRAEYDTIAAVKAAVSIPVFANGDIDSPAAAARVLAQTGADGVMIGRAALGAPWLLGQIANPASPLPTVDERFAIILAHVADMHAFYGEPGVRIARKHVQWYLELLAPEWAGDAESAGAAAAFNRLDDPGAQMDLLWTLRERLARMGQAA